MKKKTKKKNSYMSTKKLTYTYRNICWLISRYLSRLLRSVFRNDEAKKKERKKSSFSSTNFSSSFFLRERKILEKIELEIKAFLFLFFQSFLLLWNHWLLFLNEIKTKKREKRWRKKEKLFIFFKWMNEWMNLMCLLALSEKKDSSFFHLLFIYLFTNISISNFLFKPRFMKTEIRLLGTDRFIGGKSSKLKRFVYHFLHIFINNSITSWLTRGTSVEAFYSQSWFIEIAREYVYWRPLKPIKTNPR